MCWLHSLFIREKRKTITNKPNSIFRKGRCNEVPSFFCTREMKTLKKPVDRNKRNIDRIKMTVLLSFLFILLLPVTACASSQITGKIDNLYKLVVDIIKAAGAIVLAWGVFEFASAYQSHDTSQQTTSLKKIVSGLIMVFASTVIGLLT